MVQTWSSHACYWKGEHPGFTRAPALICTDASICIQAAGNSCPRQCLRMTSSGTRQGNHSIASKTDLIKAKQTQSGNTKGEQLRQVAVIAMRALRAGLLAITHANSGRPCICGAENSITSHAWKFAHLRADNISHTSQPFSHCCWIVGD